MIFLGLYSCVVKNEAGSTSANFPLRVLVAPQFTTFLHHPDIILKEGSALLLNCEVYGDPDPEVSIKLAFVEFFEVYLSLNHFCIHLF